MINPSRAWRTKSTFPDSGGSGLGQNQFTPGAWGCFPDDCTASVGPSMSRSLSCTVNGMAGVTYDQQMEV